jgi:hypothetical protein
MLAAAPTGAAVGLLAEALSAATSAVLSAHGWGRAMSAGGPFSLKPGSGRNSTDPKIGELVGAR